MMPENVFISVEVVPAVEVVPTFFFHPNLPFLCDDSHPPFFSQVRCEESKARELAEAIEGQFAGTGRPTERY